MTVRLTSIPEDNDAAHVTVRVSEARRAPGAATATGFSITRTYLDAAGQPATSFKEGDLVTVQLAVTADARHRWISLVDPLPAGFEAVNPKLASGSGAPAASSASPDPWARWAPITWTHQNLRDDRVEWFADDMPAGGDTLTYQARATIDGSFTAMPATIEAMYQPDQHARTARTQITVAK